MENPQSNGAKIDTNQIANIAYCLWEQAGRPPGRDVEFWHEAEKLAARKSHPASALEPGESTEEKAASPGNGAPSGTARPGTWSPTVVRKDKRRTRAHKTTAAQDEAADNQTATG